MREKWQKQMPLMLQITDHTQSKELEAISNIIDANPTICDRIHQDLNKGKNVAQRRGANGMSADQVQLPSGKKYSLCSIPYYLLSRIDDLIERFVYRGNA